MTVMVHMKKVKLRYHCLVKLVLSVSKKFSANSKKGVSSTKLVARKLLSSEDYKECVIKEGDKVTELDWLHKVGCIEILS